ncbi:hypothetical protein D9M70_300200 [compost metagenome]
MHHQRFRQQGGEHQRQNGHHHGAPAAEGQQAQQGNGGIDGQQHLQLHAFHHDIGRGLYAGTAGSQQELALLRAVLFRELACHLHHGAQRGGLVVRKVGQNGDQRALAVEELGVPHQGIVDLRPDNPLVIADRVPLRTAFKAARGVGPHGVGQRGGALYAGHMGQLPGETIRLDQRLIRATLVGRYLDHHREDVTGDAELRGNEGVVLVVARVGTQLGTARVQVANL